MKSMDELMNDVYIKETAQKFIASDEPEDLLELAVQIMMRIKENGTSPAPLMNVTNICWTLDGNVELEDVFEHDDEFPQKVCLIEDEHGEQWMPLYTECAEIEGLDENHEIIDRPILETVIEALERDDLSGLLINPFSEGLALRKEVLYAILHMMECDGDGEEAG